MSAWNLGKAMKESPFKLADRLVHFVLADKANDDYDNRLWMKVDWIAHRAKVSEKTVRVALGRLVEAGYLEQLQPASQHEPAQYRLIWPESRVVNTTGLDSSDRKSTDARVVIHEPCPLIDQKKDQIQTEAFASFWDAYPKRNGRKVGKRVSEGIWKRLSSEDRSAAMVGVAHYAAECGDFAKDPERWLKHRCWESYQEPAVLDSRSNGRGSVDDRARNRRLLAQMLREGDDQHGNEEAAVAGSRDMAQLPLAGT